MDKRKWYTLYYTNYGIVRAKFAFELDKDEAESIGEQQCREKGFTYQGTYSKEEIDNAEQQLREKLNLVV